MSTSSPSDLQLHKRRRSQLSCNDCKRQKLSCDRTWPCSRCVRQKRTCSYTAKHIAADVKALVEQLAKHPDSADILAGLQRTVGQSASFSQSFASERSGVDTVIPDASVKASTPLETTVLYQKHLLFSFFVSIPDLQPYVTDVVTSLAGEGVTLRKVKPATPVRPDLETMREVLDRFVDFFLKHIDNIYRVLPLDFEEQYRQFWTTPSATFEVMLLAVLSITVGASSDQAGLNAAPLLWIPHCQAWLDRQKMKQRTLTYHRTVVLVYLAKRMHMLGKKDYWQETGSIVRNAMMDGVDQMDQDLWTCICELDIQTSFEFGMPSLLSLVQCPKACRLRLDLSQKLFGREEMSYEEVLQYTDRLTKEFIPATTLRFVLMQTQLMACLIQLHAKHVETWMSRNMVYQMSKNIIMLHEQLKDDVRSISFLREDVFLASFTLLRLSLLPETGFPGANARESSVLLWRVLPWVKERYLHTCVAEPWCVLSILAIISLHTVYCGQADREEMLQISRENYLEVFRKQRERQRQEDVSASEPAWEDFWNEEWHSQILSVDLSGVLPDAVA